MNPLRYRILDKNVAHEIIDGEAIIIHFDTGSYYSLNGMAATIWQWLALGATRDEMIAAFQTITPGQIEELDAFFAILVSEQIVEKVEADSGSAPAPLPAGTVVFELPAVEKFNDMQALLLSDPIHEVDETGWPRPLPPG